MLQTGALIRDLSVRELVGMMASLYPHPLDVEEVLELTGLQEAARLRTQKLSGGQTQRARFAVALVSDPDLLVLDEPTVALDVDGRRAFWSAMRAFAARGKTILFATHYLEEADAQADRAVLMAGGRIVADGPTTEIKARVGTRTIRATLPGVPTERLAGYPGVSTAERHGDAILLSCRDSDRAIRALLEHHPEIRDIEIAGAGLEEAFVALTSADDRGRAEAGAAAGARRPAGWRPGRSSEAGGVVNGIAYTRYEIVRAFRQRRFMVFSLGFPLVLFFVIAGPNRNTQTSRARGSRSRSTTWRASSPSGPWSR